MKSTQLFNQSQLSGLDYSISSSPLGVLHQGYLQYLQGEQAQKVFVTVTNKEVQIYPEDPSKHQGLQPLSILDSRRIRLLDSGNFQRPKSFGLNTDNGVLEFSCPTNSVRSSWIKSLSEISTSSKSQSIQQNEKSMEFYRSPVPIAKNTQNPNRFSDFDGFASQALNQLSSFKVSTAPPPSQVQSQADVPTLAFRGAQSSRVLQPAAPPRRALGETAASSAKKGVTAKPQAQPQPKELPRWVPGHFKSANAVAPKNSSPQRIRNPYGQNQPQSAATLLGRSKSAPGQASQQHQYYPEEEEVHQSGQDDRNIPLEKMTLEQLRRAFNSMPSEIKSAIGIPQSQQQQSQPQYHHQHQQQQQQQFGNRGSRRPSNNPEHLDSAQYPPHPQHSQHQLPPHQQPRSTSSSHQPASHPSRSNYHQPRDYRSLEEEEEVPSQLQGYHLGMDYDAEQAEQSAAEARDYEEHQHYQQEQQEQEPYEGADDYGDVEEREYAAYLRQTNPAGNQRAIPSRLDYTDYYSEHDEPMNHQDFEEPYHHHQQQQQQNRHQSGGRGGPTTSRGRGQTPKPSERLAHGKASGNAFQKPPLVRSRSAPPSSSMAHRSPDQLPDFFSKKKSTVPRQDLLEWSKKQAWQKHVGAGFPMNKDKNNNKTTGTAGQGASKFQIPPQELNRPPSMLARQNSRAATVDARSPPNKSALMQRTKSQEPTDPRKASLLASKEKRGSIASASPALGGGSFFDFMKQRTAPNGAANPQQPAAVPPTRPLNRSAPNGFPQEDRKKVDLRQDELLLARNRERLAHSQPAADSQHHPLPQQQQRPGAQSAGKLTAAEQYQRMRSLVALQQQQPLVNGKPVPPVKPFPSSSGAPNNAAGLLRRIPSQDHQEDARMFQKASKEELSISSQSLQQQPGGQQGMTPLPLERSQSGGDLTDLAEWQRLTNWLASIKMDHYLPNFRENGVSKLSLIELLGDGDLAELGILPQDIPFIKQKVDEFAQRIKSFSEEPLLPVERKRVHRTAPSSSALGQAMGIVKPFSQKKKFYPPIDDPDVFQRNLLRFFEESEFLEFFHLWESFVYHFLSKEMVLLENLHTQQQQQQQLLVTPRGDDNNNNPPADQATSVEHPQQRPALYYAKQAIEFHLYIYFYISSIRKNLSKEAVLLTKNALKEYLEKLALIYETTSSSSSSSENNNNLPPALPLSPQQDSSKQPPRPLITSREFAAFAGLVFVPNPQENPAFHSLFKADWTDALRQRLEQFLQIIFEETRKSQQLLLLKHHHQQRSSDSADDGHGLEGDGQAGPLVAGEVNADDEINQSLLLEKAILSKLPDLAMQHDLSEKIRTPTKPAPALDEAGKPREVNEFAALILQTAEISPINAADPTNSSSHHLAAHPSSAPVAAPAQSLKNTPPSGGHRGLLPLNLSSSGGLILPPVESPQSNGSTISQLTDDTPLKNERSPFEKKTKRPAPAANAAAPAGPPAQQPSYTVHHQPPARPDGPAQQQNPPTFTFNKNNNHLLAEAASRANQKLKLMQNSAHPQPAAAAAAAPANGNVNAQGHVLPKPRSINPSPPKASLQMQVDSYNKLLKQNRLPKPSAAAAPAPALAQESSDTSQLTRVNSTTMEANTNSLLQEMQDPSNKDLINQIDAIIAPLNHSETSSPDRSGLVPTTAAAAVRPSQFLPVPAAPTAPLKFNFGLNLQRGQPAAGPVALSDQVNKYKTLLKAKSTQGNTSNLAEGKKTADPEQASLPPPPPPAVESPPPASPPSSRDSRDDDEPLSDPESAVPEDKEPPASPPTSEHPQQQQQQQQQQQLPQAQPPRSSSPLSPPPASLPAEQPEQEQPDAAQQLDNSRRSAEISMLELRSVPSAAPDDHQPGQLAVVPEAAKKSEAVDAADEVKKDAEEVDGEEIDGADGEEEDADLPAQPGEWLGGESPGADQREEEKEEEEVAQVEPPRLSSPRSFD